MMRGSVRDFVRPISARELPQLREHIAVGVHSLARTVTLLSPIATLSIALEGDLRVAVALAFTAAHVTWYVVIAALARRPIGARHPDWLAWGLCLGLMSNMALSGAVLESGQSSFAVYATITPLIVNGFIPWRPTLSLLLMLPSIGLPLLSELLFGGQTPIPATMLVFTGVAASIVAAAGCQVQRHLWLRLERANNQLVAADRMSSLGRMTAGIAHELKTPIASGLNGLESARRLVDELTESIGHPDVTEADLREIAVELQSGFELMSTSLERAGRFVASIRSQTISMNETVNVQFRVGGRFDSVATLLTHRVRKSRAVLEVGPVSPDLRISGDPAKFEQILTNLMSNALDAIDESGRGSRIAIGASETADGLVVTVEDDGPGVPPELRERIFEPLFTTRAEGSGTGLGLSLSRDLALAAFGGTLTLAESAQGARFELFCPTRGAAARRTDAWAPALGKQERRAAQRAAA